MPDVQQGLRRRWLEVHQELEQDLRVWMRSVCGEARDVPTEKRQVRVLSLAVLVFGDLVLAQRWLCRPQAFFDGKRPLEELQSERGRERVLRFLLQILHRVDL